MQENTAGGGLSETVDTVIADASHIRPPARRRNPALPAFYPRRESRRLQGTVTVLKPTGSKRLSQGSNIYSIPGRGSQGRGSPTQQSVLRDFHDLVRRRPRGFAASTSLQFTKQGSKNVFPVRPKTFPCGCCQHGLEHLTTAEGTRFLENVHGSTVSGGANAELLPSQADNASFSYVPLASIQSYAFLRGHDGEDYNQRQADNAECSGLRSVEPLPVLVSEPMVGRTQSVEKLLPDKEWLVKTSDQNRVIPPDFSTARVCQRFHVHSESFESHSENGSTIQDTVSDDEKDPQCRDFSQPSVLNLLDAKLRPDTALRSPLSSRSNLPDPQCAHRSSFLSASSKKPWSVRRASLFATMLDCSESANPSMRKISTTNTEEQKIALEVAQRSLLKKKNPPLDSRVRWRSGTSLGSGAQRQPGVSYDDSGRNTYYKPVYRRLKRCGVCGAAFLSLKRLIVPRGAFGKGRRARMAEGLAFIVYILVVSVSVNWVVVAAYLYFNTGWLGNLSTTFATYQYLEAPSVTLCRPGDPRDVAGEYFRVRAILWRNRVRYTANAITHRCPSLGLSCHCIDTHTLHFFDDAFTLMRGPVVLQDDTDPNAIAPDSLHLDFYSVGKLQRDHNVQETVDEPLEKKSGDTLNVTWPKHESFVSSRGGAALLADESCVENILQTNVQEPDRASPSTVCTTRIGIYDSKLMPELGDMPTWVVLKEYSELTAGLSLVRSWVVDIYRWSWERLLHGEFAHGEHTFLVDLHRVGSVELLNTQKNGDPRTPALAVVPLFRINLNYASYTVVEVWRVGISVSVAIMGLAAICLSAFNKIFVYNTLFPFYDKESPQRLVLSPVAETLTCGCFGANHKKSSGQCYAQPRAARSYPTFESPPSA